VEFPDYYYSGFDWTAFACTACRIRLLAMQVEIQGDFVLSPSSRSEYYQMLVSPPVWSEYFTEERHLEFLKYSYWYFYDSCYKMPIYSDEKFGHIVYNKKTMKKMNDSGYLKLEDKLTSLG